MSQAVRFQFGENWSSYSKLIDDDAVAQAVSGLSRLLPQGLDPAGRSFLDIGSGSGIHAVAASRLGFFPILAVDYDPNSVVTTKKTAADSGASVEAYRDDILNSTITEQFDVVYSWGVLHHTGDMQSAIAKAKSLVKPGGTLIIAIYTKTKFCGMWKGIKRLYCVSPPPVQKAMALGFYGTLSTGQLIRGRKALTRGMDRWHDSVDWLGGYPYESASADEVKSMVGQGFDLVQSFNTTPGLGLFGTGCGEYVFTQRSE
jgi:2-polyprenyl-6-hydroxyphenyl methylase/3-demethylubiquinone-9 3-methyltransferase